MWVEGEVLVFFEGYELLLVGDRNGIYIVVIIENFDNLKIFKLCV